SRLFQQLRENRGLVYSTYSFVASYTETGIFGVYAATRPERVEEVLEVIGRELGEMAAGGIREEDVDRAREHAKGSLMLALENTATRVGRLAGAELWREPYLSPGELIDRIERVSVQDVRALADELFAPERLSVVMLGPVAAEKPAPVRRAAAAGRRREAAREAMG
ncbi:MAG: insulinase family protein, partial [Limnochordales bacterium]